MYKGSRQLLLTVCTRANYRSSSCVRLPLFSHVNGLAFHATEERILEKHPLVWPRAQGSGRGGGAGGGGLFINKSIHSSFGPREQNKSYSRPFTNSQLFSVLSYQFATFLPRDFVKHQKQRERRTALSQRSTLCLGLLRPRPSTSCNRF